MIGLEAPPVSRLRLLFGHYPQQLKAKVMAMLSIDKQKADQARVGYSQFFAENLPARCAILQLTPNNGNAQQLATAIQQVLEKMQGASSYQIKPKATADNKVYLTIYSEEIEAMLLEIDQGISPSDLAGNNGNELEIQIASETDIDGLTNKGYNAWDYYKSLLVDIKLTKSKALTKVLLVLLKMLCRPDLIAPFAKGIEKFHTLNLDLRFASSDIIPPQLRGEAPPINDATGDADFEAVMQLCSLIAPNSQATIYSSNVIAQVQITGFSLLRQLLYLESQS